MSPLNERTFRILTGVVALLTLAATVTLGAKIAYGALRPTYEVTGTFSAAGQGLISGSDVKIHGVNVGRVANIALVEGRARVRMTIEDAEKIPISARAVIRPKTLFGEKFVDIEPGADEARGPFLRDGAVIAETLGGFELERVLAEAYPILRSVKPEELLDIITTLSSGAEGLGPNVNRTIGNFAALGEVSARNAAKTQQFLDDFAALSEELAKRADDVVGTAHALNEALPPINQRADGVAAVLDGLARLSADTADILEANRPLLNKLVTEGGKTVQLLDTERANIGPLVVGLRQFFQVLAEAATGKPFGDGTNLAKIKLVLGEDCPNGRVDPCPGEQPASAAGPTQAPAVSPAPGPVTVPAPTTGVSALRGLIRGLVG
ncbi:MAG TPA: MlaD family protein [Acidimicrobiales bacterium]|nr:MlaD family protein [Acidimicrobiales bacterium]